MSEIKKVGILTAGGLAPCLSSAVAGLVERYSEIAPEVEIICYLNGYKGLLLGESVPVTPAIREKISLLHRFGGSPIGNSRVKLTNVENCVERGLVKEGQDPQTVAAEQLVKDGVDVLHTIGGDDTSTAAADLARYLHENQHDLTVVGLPKTVDNDIVPVRQSLGADTAAEEGANFFSHVCWEHSANPRMLIVHEVMGRNCGWLAAATARKYNDMLKREPLLPELHISGREIGLGAVFVPEMEVDIPAEAERLRARMDEIDAVNIFLSEGAGVEAIVADMEARGEEVPKDPFGHYKLDAINPGQWFAKQFSKMLGAEKVLVQKSGYYARASAANAYDLRLIKSCVDLAVDRALERESGLIGHDEERGGRLRAIEFDRVGGGKTFDIDSPWFGELLADVGQEKGAKITPKH